MSLVDTKLLIRLVILSMTSSRWDKKHEEADGREEKKAEDFYLIVSQSTDIYVSAVHRQNR